MTTTETKTQWQYLEKRPHPWRQQLYLKGRKLRAFILYANMLANDMTPEEAADNWDLPFATVAEVIEYCKTHQELLRQEAEAGYRRLADQGIPVEPATRGTTTRGVMLATRTDKRALYMGAFFIPTESVPTYSHAACICTV